MFADSLDSSLNFLMILCNKMYSYGQYVIHRQCRQMKGQQTIATLFIHYYSKTNVMKGIISQLQLSWPVTISWLQLIYSYASAPTLCSDAVSKA